ncbi:unnamed protein product [Heligmosomoides polygyrus]|uniref:MFS domain-containing protein n=1 Tax=Heligmosomoides polygyrus TaxID=6339 RepID=A0A183GAW9_HELPZ|nr:unnamed protein product [Heligmosomoides polygyrus]
MGGNAMMRETESNADSDADAETRSAPGDLGAPPRSRATKWSHSRQASQGVPYRNVEKPRRIRDIRDRQWQFYDFGYVLFCIPVSYFGGRHSKPVVLGAGLALIAIGSLLFSTPHMLADSYSANQDVKSFSSCAIRTDWNYSEADASAFSASCAAQKQNQPGTFRFVFLFCLAHFLHGIGATPLFTIGVSYIDENVGKALSSLFVGIFYSFVVFGPAAGFLTAGTFLTYHTDFWHLPAEQISR